MFGTASCAEQDPTLVYDDGADNDGDGQIASADSSCPYWEELPCGLGLELAGAIPLIAWLHRRRGRLRRAPH